MPSRRDCPPFAIRSAGRERGWTLNALQEFEDPEVLGNRAARFIAWTKVPGEHVLPYECDPSYAANYVK